MHLNKWCLELIPITGTITQYIHCKCWGKTLFSSCFTFFHVFQLFFFFPKMNLQTDFISIGILPFLFYWIDFSMFFFTSIFSFYVLWWIQGSDLKRLQKCSNIFSHWSSLYRNAFYIDFLFLDGIHKLARKLNFWYHFNFNHLNGIE